LSINFNEKDRTVKISLMTKTLLIKLKI